MSIKASTYTDANTGNPAKASNVSSHIIAVISAINAYNYPNNVNYGNKIDTTIMNVVSQSKVAYSTPPSSIQSGSKIAQSSLRFLAQLQSDHQDNIGPCTGCSKTCLSNCTQGCISGCTSCHSCSGGCDACRGCDGCNGWGACSCTGCNGCSGCRGCGRCGGTCDTACTAQCTSNCNTGCNQTCFNNCSSSCTSGCSSSDRIGVVKDKWNTIATASDEGMEG